MYYISWDSQSIEGLGKSIGCAILYTEVDQSGRVLREIGVDEEGWIVHCAPSSRNAHGLFDNQMIDKTSLRNDISEQEFLRLWARRSP